METKPSKAIVIVDDEKSYTDLLERVLGEHFKCPIITFSNPIKMLDALHCLDVGIVVTDYYMPHRNGIDLIHRLGELSPLAPPCLLMTGHSLDEDDEEMSKPAHLKAILPKPFTWRQLAELIEKHWPVDAGSPVRAAPRSLHD